MKERQESTGKRTETSGGIQTKTLNQIFDAFQTEGKIRSIRPMGKGHINTTFLVETDRAKFTLQKINTKVFSDIDGLMKNICAVTAHIEKIRPTVRPVFTQEGNPYLVSDEGECYRVMTFMDGDVCDRAENASDMYIAGKGYGRFHRDLNGFSEKLTETIPRFHDTRARFEALRTAFFHDAVGRAEATHSIFEEYMGMESLCDEILTSLFDGKVPVRVTHNDTKINNIIIDRAKKEPVCVIDLDTVMYGTLLYDFGDAVRSGCTHAAEDARDLKLLVVDMEYFRAFLKGFGEEVRSIITDDEVRLLASSSAVMTYECGMRFMTDYLNGDIYFRTSYDKQNLFRATSQLALAKDILQHRQEMEEATRDFFRK